MSLSFIIWQVYIIFRSSDSLHSWGDNNNNNELLSCKIRSFQIDPIFDFEDKDLHLLAAKKSTSSASVLAPICPFYFTTFAR